MRKEKLSRVLSKVDLLENREPSEGYCWSTLVQEKTFSSQHSQLCRQDIYLFILFFLSIISHKFNKSNFPVTLRCYYAASHTKKKRLKTENDFSNWSTHHRSDHHHQTYKLSPIRINKCAVILYVFFFIEKIKFLYLKYGWWWLTVDGRWLTIKLNFIVIASNKMFFSSFHPFIIEIELNRFSPFDKTDISNIP